LVFCELRTPHRIPTVTEFLLSGCRYTVEFLSDDARRNGPDAAEGLKLARDRPELINRLDALSVENIPGKLRQIKTLNRPFAGWEMARHLLFLSLTGGAHASLSRRCLISYRLENTPVPLVLQFGRSLNSLPRHWIESPEGPAMALLRPKRLVRFDTRVRTFVKRSAREILTKGDQTVEQAAEVIVRLAALGEVGPTACFFFDDGWVP
jgi:hypothetical protein